MKIIKRYSAVIISVAFMVTSCTIWAETHIRPIWLDTAPLTEQSVVLKCAGGSRVRVDVLGVNLFRIRHSKTNVWTESALNRYGIFTSSFPKTEFENAKAGDLSVISTSGAKLIVNHKDGSIRLSAPDSKVLTQQAAPIYENGAGYDLRFSLTKDERLYGLGDASRENIMRRGGIYEMWVLNVKSYIPIPMILSNRGWGVLMNTSWRNIFDVGKTDPNSLICSAQRSDLDYYIFSGADYRSMLETYTALTGRPALLPIWGYAFTYVCNENIDMFNMVNEALEFRRQDMPCDVIGLEPGWMSKYYDYTIEKKWDKTRFPIPSWAPNGPNTFIGALTRKGFKLSLWLCCNYDLGVYEEQLLAGVNSAVALKDKPDPKANPDDFEKDEHLNGASAKKKTDAVKDSVPKPLEPWFEHLKKFVDQNVNAFKLDGSQQVVEHPTRKWGNGMTDEEMHNLYPVIYAKQMSQGYEDHTRERSMVYSAGGYAGVQQFVATWAGDTGGGAKPLVSMLNLGFSGHSNHSCDMNVFSSEGIHFGFLQTWAQENNWAYWRQPWLLTDDLIVTFREYGQLRYKLLPYIYSSAAEASMTGYPVMRAMSLLYPDDPAWDSCRSQYMLGDYLLVSVYSKEIRVPAGSWIDFWSGVQVEGPATLPVTVSSARGGALLVKAGAIIPTWPPCQYVEKGWSSEVGLLVYPAQSSNFTLYEDDGIGLGYRTGKFAKTLILCETIDKGVRLTIGGRQGSYSGMPASRNFTVSIHLLTQPKTITLDGAIVESVWDATAKVATVKIPGCGKSPRVLMIDSK